MNINDIIVETALEFENVQELKGNSGWHDPVFEQLMENMGWSEGEAWCAYAAEGIWKLAYQKYDARQFDVLDKLFSAGAVRTYHNFRKHSYFNVSKTPELGAMMVWQKYKNGKPHWSGHIGAAVVEIINDNKVINMEGNTNLAGSREGTHFMKKEREVSYEIKSNGLNLLGFVLPLDTAI